jgi:hypothetical protein
MNSQSGQGWWLALWNDHGCLRLADVLGVVEYWIIDRFTRQMTVCRNAPEGLSELVVAEQDTYQTPLLPGFELPLARLLAVADRSGYEALLRYVRE